MDYHLTAKLDGVYGGRFIDDTARCAIGARLYRVRRNIK
jgi:hypothetical protein